MIDRTLEVRSPASGDLSIGGLTCCLVGLEEVVDQEQFAGVVDVQEVRCMHHERDYRRPESGGCRIVVHLELE